jgi:hypothetical protein
MHLARLLFVLLLAFLLAYITMLRPWHLRWGATSEEVQRALRGDEMVPAPKLKATHAITIRAPREDVWPWLVQIGQGRGGFYSYEWLENLAGCDIHNADRVLPQFQTLHVGDSLRLHPDAPALPVGIADSGHAVVLGEYPAARAARLAKGAPGEPMVASWGFYLFDTPEGQTRVVIRFRSDWEPSVGAFFGFRVFLEPAHFIMEQKMLRTLIESERLNRRENA